MTGAYSQGFRPLSHVTTFMILTKSKKKMLHLFEVAQAFAPYQRRNWKNYQRLVYLHLQDTVLRIEPAVQICPNVAARRDSFRM